MTVRERDRLRDLQDRIVRICDGRGYPDTTRLSADLPPEITVGALRRYIFPKSHSELLAVLRELAS